jgi:hypothetical protein
MLQLPPMLAPKLTLSVQEQGEKGKDILKTLFDFFSQI